MKKKEKDEGRESDKEQRRVRERNTEKRELDSLTE